MKYLNILALMLVALVAYTSAQCPRNPSCHGHRDVGRGGHGCHARTTWYYDSHSRQCREMHYLGCRGNSNRWCTRAACEHRCRR